MKKLRIGLTAVFGLTLAILFCQCEKDEPIGIKRGKNFGALELSQAEQNIVPYSVSDSIIFKDSLGNSEVFKVSSRITHLEGMYTSCVITPSMDYYDSQEMLYVQFRDTNQHFIGIDLTPPMQSYCSNQNINKNYFRIIFSGNLDSLYWWSNSFCSYIDTTTFYYTLEGASISYYPVFTIFNKTYYSVYEIIGSFPESEHNPKTVYYNKSKGIVGFQMKNGTKWYLDN